MGDLNQKGLHALIEKPGRYPDGGGLYFKTIGLGRAYWTYRYTLDGKGTEISLGPYPEVKLDEARLKHAQLRATVLQKIDPLGDRRSWTPIRVQAKPVAASPRKKLARAEAPDLTHLYRHYDFDGTLLYVGVSNNTLDRWSGHKVKATWADQVATITIEHYPTRQKAEAAEADAIIAEKPLFNGSVRLYRKESAVNDNASASAE